MYYSYAFKYPVLAHVQGIFGMYFLPVFAVQFLYL